MESEWNLALNPCQQLIRLGRRARIRCLSRHTTRDKKMTMVIRSEKSVATRARPKIEGLLSAFSRIPSYRYSPPKRDRTGLNHDRLNIIVFSLVKGRRLGSRRNVSVGVSFW